MRRISHAGGVAAYLVLVVLIMRFDPAKLLAPLPLLSILAGTVLLTVIQLRRGQSWPERMDLARWNAFLSGLLTALVELLALFSSPDAFEDTRALSLLVEALIPLLYGSILSLALDVRPRRGSAATDKEAAMSESADTVSAGFNDSSVAGGDAPMQGGTAVGTGSDATVREGDTAVPGGDAAVPTIELGDKADAVTSVIRVDTETAHRILVRQGLTERECHVALKLIGDVPNRDIAESLYISETTVKKHIQNLFRKCGATDRRVFRQLFLTWMREDARCLENGNT